MTPKDRLPHLSGEEKAMQENSDHKGSEDRGLEGFQQREGQLEGLG